MQRIDLKVVERSAFKAAVDTGLWDVFIAALVAMLPIVSLLGGTLGDFWSPVVFLPVLGGTYLAIRFVQERVVVPRVGQVRWGSYRKARLKRFTVAMLTVNVVALALGGVAFIATQRGAEELWVFPAMLSVVLLVGFSFASYSLNLPRLFLYGLLLAGGSLIGEALFRQGRVSHHGFPLVFGTAALMIATIGLIKFALVVRSTRPVSDEASVVEDDD
jgi:hypothetical protein